MSERPPRRNERPPVHFRSHDPYLHWPDGSVAMCDDHPSFEALAVTEYSNAGWLLECAECYEENFDANA